jgi:hypothetical protein
LISSIPIIENENTARKIDLEVKPPRINLAETPLPPVVFTYNFTMGVVVPSMVTDVGEIEQLEFTGPAQVKAIVPLKPLIGATETL